jgi:hypothetical protein
MRARAAFICFLIALTASAAMAASPKLVYRIDRATATIVDNRLVVMVMGAVRSGGWAKPKLRLHEVIVPEARTLEIDFVATPPRRAAVVVQAILPVSVKLKTRLPHYGVAEVKIVSETNSVTVPIAPQSAIRRNATQITAKIGE